MTARATLFGLVMFAVSAARGAQAQTAVVGEISVASDREHFDTLRVRAGAFFNYGSPFSYAGLTAQTSHYTRSAWNRDAPAVLFLWRRQQRDTLAGTIAEAGVVRVAGRTRLIGDATWSLRPRERTGIELIASGDLVETQPALDRAIAYTFVAISGEQQISSRLTIIGLAGYQHFTDANARMHVRGRLIWMMVPKQGISAQLRWRQYKSKDLDVDSAYFNPERYREWQAGIAMRKRHAGWIWSGTLAAGRENISGISEHSTSLAEVRTEGTLRKDVHLVVHASYNRSAGFAAADGYWFRVVGVTLILPIARQRN
jgi:hypothetical protein